MIWLSQKSIVSAHDKLMQATGGLNGIRDENLLNSALIAPFQAFDGVELFPTVVSKAARLAFGLTSNHPFFDGNKRIGAHSMLLILELNNLPVLFRQDELALLFFSVAEGKSNCETVREWIENHLMTKNFN